MHDTRMATCFFSKFLSCFVRGIGRKGGMAWKELFGRCCIASVYGKSSTFIHGSMYRVFLLAGLVNLTDDLLRWWSESDVETAVYFSIGCLYLSMSKFLKAV